MNQAKHVPTEPLPFPSQMFQCFESWTYVDTAMCFWSFKCDRPGVALFLTLGWLRACAMPPVLILTLA